MDKLKTDLKKSEELADQFYERLKLHMPDTSDVVLIVLKGHLLIEEIINEALCLLMHNPDIYMKTNPRFNVKLCLLRALTLCYEMSAFGAALKLNTIRNKLAHHLEPQDVEALMEEYLKYIDDSRITDEHSLPLRFTDKRVPLAERLKDSIYYLVGQLGLLAGVAPILNNILNSYNDGKVSEA